MSHRTVLSLAAGFLLSLALGACAANDPGEVRGFAAGDAIAAPASTPAEGAPAAHDHAAHARGKGNGSTPATPSSTAPAPPPSKNGGGQPATSTPTPPAGPNKLYFATPEAAMRYLTAAYNSHDLTALKHVTNESARANLEGMRSMADNLRLVDCEANPAGDYLCAFVHDYPAKLHKTGRGTAHFTVAPVRSVGWYMTVLDDCS